MEVAPPEVPMLPRCGGQSQTSDGSGSTGSSVGISLYQCLYASSNSAFSALTRVQLSELLVYADVDPHGCAERLYKCLYIGPEAPESRSDIDSIISKLSRAQISALLMDTELIHFLK
mmetsp:Transcript_83994/g.242831  ORF Transcript_83994/g.242831 Transcript_83994/m.242831 type:complete len:117 (-) Transcript_83994:147-497(-)